MSVSAVVKLYVVDVAPGMSVNVVQSVDTCHFTDGAGLPVAAALSVASAPAQYVPATGFVVIVGVVLTVRTAVVCTEPAAFVKTAR